MAPAGVMARRPQRALVVAATTFVALTGAILLLDALPIDAQIREALLARAGPSVVAALRVANWAGDWRLLLPGTMLLFVAFAQARAQWWIWFALMIAAPITEWLLKQAIGRPRPEAVSLGFPSGHAAAAAAFFGAVIYLAGALPSRAARVAVRAGAVVAIALVALARVVLRAHWPSDVLGGAALGLALAAAAALVASAQAPGGRGR